MHLLHRSLLAGLLALLLAGCETDNTPQLSRDITALGTKIDDTQKKIDASNQHIESIDTRIKTTQQERIDALEQQKQQAAEFVYGANQANTTNTAPNLYTHHVGNELIRASSILGMPTQQSILDANRRLEQLLSQKEQDLAALKAEYAEKDKSIASLQGALATNKTALTQLDQEHQQTVAERNTLQVSKGEISAALDQKQKQLIATQQGDLRRADDAKALKKQLMVYLALAATGAAIGVAAYIKYRRTAEIGDNAIGAAQDLKNRASDGDQDALAAYGELRTHLVDWFGESGHDLEDELQSHLRSMNLIGKQPMPSLLPKLKALQAAKALLKAGKHE